MKLRKLLEKTAEILLMTGNENVHREAAEIVCMCLKKDRAYLYAHAFDEVSVELSEKILADAQLKVSGMPLQYIFGSAAFMDLILKADKRAFIPRPETELLAEKAAGCLEFKRRSGGGLSVLDLCTGGGGIAIYLASQFPEAKILASDISDEALELASENAAANTTAQIQFIKSDLFENITGKFDLITANPPYIPSDVIEELDSAVKNYEPRLALDGGPDGLETIRLIIKKAPCFLKSGGELLMEIGHDQASAVLKAAASSAFTAFQIYKDLGGCDRLFSAEK